MIELSKIFVPAQTREDQDHLRYICSAIEVALAPWDPGKITLYVSHYDSDAFYHPTLTVETELLPRLPFSSQLDLLSMDEHQAMCKYADEACKWFFYRHQTPVEDHIILGTD